MNTPPTSRPPAGSDRRAQKGAASGPVRVLLVDDSPTVRAVLKRLLRGDVVEIVGEAADGVAAVAAVNQLRPDVVLMDLEMPLLSGARAIQQIMASRPTPVLVLTAHGRRDQEAAFQAMRAGAVDLIAKPTDPAGWRDLEHQLPELLLATAAEWARRRELAAHAAAKTATDRVGRPVGAVGVPPAEPLVGQISVAPEVLGRSAASPTAANAETATIAPSWRSPARDAASLEPAFTERVGTISAIEPGTAVALRRELRWVAVGASTGGPVAIRDLLEGLPASLPVSVLIVQHIALGFEEGLAEWLARDLRRDVRVARDGEVARPGAVRFAPAGAHLLLERGGTLRLDRERPPRGQHRPSADELFLSCALVAPRNSAGVLLTGMGRDGAEGLLALRRAGGITLVQDAATASVWGMPKVALDRGAADLALPPREIARALVLACEANR